MENMSFEKKMEILESITVSDFMQWLDGAVVSYHNTELQLSAITGEYCSKELGYTRFNNESVDKLCLSNRTWLVSEKPLIEEYNSKKNKYWEVVSNNAVRKCETKDDICLMIFRRIGKYFQFHWSHSRYDYFNIFEIVSRCKDYCASDKSEEIKTLESEIKECRSEIRRIEEHLQRLQSKKGRLDKHQHIHEKLYGYE